MDVVGVIIVWVLIYAIFGIPGIIVALLMAAAMPDKPKKWK